MYLIYSTRPKNESKHYNVHIDAYEKQSLAYRASWQIPVTFSFLPVHRISTQLIIPSRNNVSKNCSPNRCVHGQCTQYVGDTNVRFCRCHQGWSGRDCSISHTCICSNDSLCVGVAANNRSVCVCPLGKFGPRCLLKQMACQDAPCLNDGHCVPMDEHVPSENKFFCMCPEGFRGDRCEIPNIKIVVSFHKDILLLQTMHAHLIQTFDDQIPRRTTKHMKIPIDDNSVTVYSSHPFHILVVELVQHEYYLAVLRKTLSASTTVSSTINRSHRCPHISEIFNETFARLDLLRRIKYYHLPCEKYLSQLVSCFFDDIHLCFCTGSGHQRLANCLEFDHRMKFDCLGQNACENGGSCYFDNQNCPQSSICQCSECFYGSRCQFSTKGFGLSLDAILGYQIRPHVTLLHQSLIIQVSAILTMIMFVIGIVNSVLCLMTFQGKKQREIGCGLYLLGMSITSLLAMTMFTLKFWFLIFSQMALIKNRSFLNFQCTFMDFLVRICLGMDQWLNGCVAIERAITVMKGVSFDRKRSKQIAKWIILTMILLTISIVISDPIYRRLIDGDEERIWCVVSYPPWLEVFNSAVHIFHTVVPCLINLISALTIIITIARRRATVHTHRTYINHLREQFEEHKQLLIAPCVLITLTIPRLVLALTSGCMRSAHNPWLFLVGYFISFIPVLMTFVAFVLPSQVYKKEFYESIRRYRKALQQRLSFNS